MPGFSDIVNRGRWIAALAVMGQLLSGRDAPPPVAALQPIAKGTFTLYSENDVFFSGTDQYYTNGAKATWLSAKKKNLTTAGANRVSTSIGKLVDQLTPDHDGYKLGVSFGQNMYSPADITVTTFQPDDRPYAAWLYGSLSFHVESKVRPRPGLPDFDRQLTSVELTVGITGPDAIGQQVQDFVHDFWGIDRAQGWAHQIGYQLGANLTVEKKLRWRSEGASDGLGWDVMPHLGASLGNVNTHVNTGLEIRYGYKLPDDFGTKLIRPGSSNSANSRARFRLFAFAAFDAKYVIRDLLLEGSTVSGPTRIRHEPLVADFQGGIALAGKHFQLTYSQVVRTKAFTTQPEHFDFGAAAVSFFY
ncbi:MAG: lipid A deacylase LpxR family protein [Synoicihabitans sp.]